MKEEAQKKKEEESNNLKRKAEEDPEYIFSIKMNEIFERRIGKLYKRQENKKNKMKGSRQSGE